MPESAPMRAAPAALGPARGYGGRIAAHTRPAAPTAAPGSRRIGAARALQ